MLPISVVICTCNRATSVRTALASVVANTYPQFEVILVDQSDGLDTERSVQQFCSDARFRYIRSTTKGLGYARNIGLRAATHAIIAFTDDDCIVPENWLAVIASIFEKHSRVAVAFCNVVPAPYPQAQGWTPNYIRHDSKLVRTLWEKNHARGIGAGMALRRDLILGIGGFDESLGAGARFGSCEDRDVAVRALDKNFWVYETHEVAVVHDGFRDVQQLKALTKRDFFGMGAAYVKLLKCGRLLACSAYTYDILIVALWMPLSQLLHLQVPRGFGRLWHFCRGFASGLRTPVDRRYVVYRSDR